MNDLLARIDEFRRAQPDGMGDKEWFLSGSRVLLRQRRDWRDWGQSGLLFLVFGGIGVAIALSDWEQHINDSILEWLSALLFCLWMSGFGDLLFCKTLLKFEWRQQVMTKPRDRGELTPLSEIECIVGEPSLPEDEGPAPLYAILWNGRRYYLPNLLRVSSLRRNTAAYGFILDKPALYFDDNQHLEAFREDGRIDLSRLWAADAERLSPDAWRDDRSPAVRKGKRSPGERPGKG